MVIVSNNSSFGRNGGVSSNTNMTAAEVFNGLSLPTKISILCIILTLAFLGNFILIVSIIKTPRMRKSVTNQLILNLAVCDIMIVVTGISGEIIYQMLGTWVLGEIGCRLLYPVSTYAIIAAVTTLLMICVDRFVAASYPFRYRILKTKSPYVLAFVHVYALACVVPYSFHLTLTLDNGVLTCGETWPESSGTIYTIFLFVIQYGVPLPIIITLYAKTWIRIKRQNDNVIKNAERLHRESTKQQNKRVRENSGHTRQSLLSVDSDPTNNNTKRRSRTLLETIRESFISLYESEGEPSQKFISQTAIDRHKQTVKLLKLFICVVLVFAVCMLPNHIVWLNIAITGQSLLSNETQYLIAYWLTYANSVFNPIIYGIHPRFRVLYSNSIKEVLNFFTNLCFKRQFYETEEPPSMVTGESSVYSVWTPDSIRKRFSRTFSTRSNSSRSSFKKRKKSGSDSLPRNENTKRRSMTIPPRSQPVKKRSLTIPQITVTDIERNSDDVFTENRHLSSAASTCSNETIENYSDDVFVQKRHTISSQTSSEADSSNQQFCDVYIDKEFFISRDGLLLLETMSESDC